jgi:N-acetylmuramoyl-L-alanine amidase
MRMFLMFVYIFCLTVFAGFCQVTGLSGWDICLDPGHSQTENMGIFGYSEAEKNVRVALNLRNLLLTKTDIDTVYLTRADDQQIVGLSQRSTYANSVGASWFHSIHSDAGGNTSNSTLLLWGQYNDGREKIPNGGHALSDIIVVNLTSGMRTDTRGSIGDCSFYGCGDWLGPYLSVNRLTEMPSELSEAGFHTNPRQNTLNMNDDWKRLEAYTFFWSILDFHLIERPQIRILAGIVSDTDTGIPLNGAQITFNDSVYITDTYESLFYKYSEDPDLLHNGFYYFENIIEDEIQVTVQAENFYSDTATVALIDNFFTFQDFKLVSTIPPFIQTTLPVAGDTAFSAVEDIVIQFSRPMNRASVESTLVISEALMPIFTWRNNDQDLIISTDSLKFNTDYTITISGQASDRFDHLFDGNKDGVGGDDFLLSFRTGSDFVPPQLLNIYPLLNMDEVELRPIVSLTYDEELDSASVTGDIFKLERLSDKTGVDGELVHYIFEKQSILNFFPQENLKADEVYVTRVYPGLKDMFGNEVTLAVSKPFITGVLDQVITGIENFESGVADWWQPDASGSTTGYKGTIYRVADTEFTNRLTTSSTSMALYYNWDPSAGAWLIREYLSGGAPRNVVFDRSYHLQVYVFGDGSGNKFRFALDEGTATDWPNHEVSQWYTINWIGWKLVDWDLSDPQQVGSWIGNGVLDGIRYRIDSFQLTYEDGATPAGFIYFDDLQLAKKFNVLEISEEDSEVPKTFSLEQNYPNPFNPLTHINFSLSESNFTSLIIYDVLGKIVSTPVDEKLAAGNYTALFDGSALASGMYFYVLRSGPYLMKHKMVLIK